MKLAVQPLTESGPRTLRMRENILLKFLKMMAYASRLSCKKWYSPGPGCVECRSSITMQNSNFDGSTSFSTEARAQRYLESPSLSPFF